MAFASTLTRVQSAFEKAGILFLDNDAGRDWGLACSAESLRCSPKPDRWVWRAIGEDAPHVSQLRVQTTSTRVFRRSRSKHDTDVALDLAKRHTLAFSARLSRRLLTPVESLFKLSISPISRHRQSAPRARSARVRRVCVDTARMIEKLARPIHEGPASPRKMQY
jgi:hypothetical protein